MTKCTYCGRTDHACQTDAQVIGCDPMPFTQSFKATIDRYDDLPAGNKADYERAHSTPRQRLAEAIRTASEPANWCVDRPMVVMEVDEAHAILAELDRSEMQATIDGDMPCS